MALEISEALSNSYKHSDSIDFKSLSIIPRSSCWVLHVDVLLLQCGGNLLDAISLAVKAALLTTRLPKVTVVRNEVGSDDLEISDDPDDVMQLNVEKCPLLVTVSKVGHSQVVDATLAEEACCLGKIYVAVENSGCISYMRKAGGGSFDPFSVQEMLETARSVGKALNASLIETIKQEQKLKLQSLGLLK